MVNTSPLWADRPNFWPPCYLYTHHILLHRSTLHLPSNPTDKWHHQETCLQQEWWHFVQTCRLPSLICTFFAMSYPPADGDCGLSLLVECAGSVIRLGIQPQNSMVSISLHLTTLGFRQITFSNSSPLFFSPGFHVEIPRFSEFDQNTNTPSTVV